MLDRTTDIAELTTVDLNVHRSRLRWAPERHGNQFAVLVSDESPATGAASFAVDGL